MQFTIHPCYTVKDEDKETVVAIKDTKTLDEYEPEFFGVYKLENGEEHHVDDFPTMSMAVMHAVSNVDITSVVFTKAGLEFL